MANTRRDRLTICTGWGSPNGSGLINLLAPAAGGTTPQTITFTTSCTVERGLQQSVHGSGDGQFRLGSHVHQFGIVCSNSGASATIR